MSHCCRLGIILRIRYTNSACTQTHSRDEIPSSTLAKTKASSIKREAAMVGRHGVTAGVIISRCGAVIIFSKHRVRDYLTLALSYNVCRMRLVAEPCGVILFYWV